MAPSFRTPHFLQKHIGHPLRLAAYVLNVAFISHVFGTYFYSHANPYGPSMLPRFAVSGEGYIIARKYKLGRDVAVGDAVAYRIPIEPDAEAIKRVVGLPGDYVLINSPDSGRDAMIQVPEGHCWLVGDNLPVSRDSRTYGPIPLGLIRGKVIAQYYPWANRGWVQNPLIESASVPAADSVD